MGFMIQTDDEFLDTLFGIDIETSAAKEPDTLADPNIRIHIAPCNLSEANQFVKRHHRHHRPCTGHKFSISVRDDSDVIHGVAICGRPVSRHLDDGLTLEINRCCTDGVRNGCSMLYGACARIAKDMGYHKIITYILETENGSSLKASNFICEGTAGGTMWTGLRSGHDNGVPQVLKKRYVKYLYKGSDKKDE